MARAPLFFSSGIILKRHHLLSYGHLGELWRYLRYGGTFGDDYMGMIKQSADKGSQLSFAGASRSKPSRMPSAFLRILRSSECLRNSSSKS